MSQDLSHIFDLDRLRRVWGDESGAQVKGPVAETPPPPVETAPLRLFAQLEEAIDREFQDPRQRSLLAVNLESLRALLKQAETASAEPADLERGFDELEDLLDAWTLSPAAESQNRGD